MIETGPEDEARGPEKMSKSLGNVYNLQDIVDHGFRPSALRYLYLGVHYRKQLKFSWTAMAQAEEALKRLTDFLARLDSLPAREPNPEIAARLQEAADGFSAHIRHDVNSAAAIGVMFDLVRALNSAIDAAELGSADAPAVRELLALHEERLELPSSVRCVRDLATLLGQRHPALVPHFSSVRFALNESFVDTAALLSDGDVVALIPPVTGG